MKNEIITALIAALLFGLTSCSPKVAPRVAPEYKKEYVYQKTIVDSPAHCPPFDMDKLSNSDRPVKFPYTELSGVSVWPMHKLINCQWRSYEKERVLTKSINGYSILGILTSPIIDFEKAEYIDNANRISLPYEMEPLDDFVFDLFVDKFHTNQKASFHEISNFLKIDFDNLIKDNAIREQSYAFIGKKIAKASIYSVNRTIYNPEEPDAEPTSQKHSYLKLSFSEEDYKSAKSKIEDEDPIELFLFTNLDSDQPILSITISNDPKLRSVETVNPTVFLAKFRSLSSSTKHRLAVLGLMNQYLQKQLVTSDTLTTFFESELDFVQNRWSQTPLKIYTEDIAALDILYKLRNEQHNCIKSVDCDLPKYQLYYQKYLDIEEYFSHFERVKLSRLRTAVSLVNNPISEEKLTKTLLFLKELKKRSIYEIETEEISAFEASAEFVDYLDSKSVGIEHYAYIASVFTSLVNVGNNNETTMRDLNYLKKQSHKISKKMQYNTDEQHRFQTVLNIFNNYFNEPILSNRKKIIKESRNLIFDHNVTFAQIDNITQPIYVLLYMSEFMYPDNTENDNNDDEYYDDEHYYGGGYNQIGSVEPLEAIEAYAYAKKYAVLFNAPKDKITEFTTKLKENVRAALLAIPDEIDDQGDRVFKKLTVKQYKKIIKQTEIEVYEPGLVNLITDDQVIVDTDISEEN